MDSTGLWRALTVGCGGFVGAVARYAVGGLAHRVFPNAFPIGTFVVNVSGCFAIGFLATLFEHRFAPAPGVRLFWLVGVIGGYTTYSTFGYETLALLREGSHAAATANVVGQVLFGLAAVWFGIAAGRALS